MLVVVLLLPLLGRERAVGMKSSSPDRKCKRDVAIPTDFFFGHEALLSFTACDELRERPYFSVKAGCLTNCGRF